MGKGETEAERSRARLDDLVDENAGGTNVGVADLQLDIGNGEKKQNRRRKKKKIADTRQMGEEKKPTERLY